MACCVGEEHTVCLSDEGIVHSFGSNKYHQLGCAEQNVTFKSLPFQVTSFHMNNQILPLPIIKEISCGAYFTICLDYEGSLYSFGQNKQGELGIGNTILCHFPQKVIDIPPVKTISCGVFHTLAITEDDNLWSFGANENGQLCLGNKTNQSTPQQTAFSNIVRISAGYHSLFQNDKDEIYGCGSNQHGQLGEHSENFKITNHPPNIIQFYCGYYHSLFLDPEGKVFSIGINNQGNLGLGVTETNRKVFTQIPNIPPIRTISCVGHSSYLIDLDGNLWCFGFNRYHQLGFGDSINTLIPTKHSEIEGISQITSGCCGNHFLAQNYDNQIFVGGNNDYGQLGTGNTTSKTKYQEINSEYFSMWGKSQSIKNRVKSARK